MRRKLELHPGPCPGERYARSGLAWLALVSVLLAPTALPWKILGLAALAAAWRFSAAPATDGMPAILTLFPDGTASLARSGRPRAVAVTGRAWLSRLLCVIEVERLDGGGTEWLRICAARHPAADYRRLLGLMRLRAFPAPEPCHE